ncbi:aminotransferase class I/II-fold pyridoxal phosphate-dependent enzyme [Candidatus Bathyarchaeota archaeon]|nr:aminotransferase class I/II-fold pyridoxal phosphate-dependent enzyme [Candidatus Bathyarchaeota archaeon]
MRKEIVDLRSDTVTLPTQEMLEAISSSPLGDDVFNEDPTVNELEKLAAEKMGKEAALLVSSGTQANLVSLISNTKRGNLVILEAQSHIIWYEAGGISSIAGLQPWPIESTDGVLNPSDIENAIQQKNIHFAEPALICIENTHNRHGGTIITPKQIKKIGEVAHSHGLKLYMDGARLFNAAVALKIAVKEFTKHVDNLMFCLSKGLSCPVGSILVGSFDFIEKAREVRKILGGGMRQAGIIAAPGIIALETMIDRLEDDHRNARILAEGIEKIKGINVDLNRVQTNIVNFKIGELGIAPKLFVSRLKENGILALELDFDRIRMVTHSGINEDHVKRAIKIINKISKKIF